MNKSNHLYQLSNRFIPGGVNSPARAFIGLDSSPFFVERADGPYLFDVDGNSYIDYLGSWGPIILGHNNPEIKKAVTSASELGLSFGTPTSIEVKMAETITTLMPSIELVRMVNSGTEATMSAIRLARGYTNRNKLIKFEGCYHGHSDCLLVNSSSRYLKSGKPSSSGIPKDFTKHTLICEYNNIKSVESMFRYYPEDIACVIVEPIAGNMNCVPPKNGFLNGLRELCTQYGVVLIFDEVITGFRVELGGAQALYDINPDLTTLGKIIGGGMPVGAFGGKREIMECVSPVGTVYQAGTLSGNPIAMAAGLSCLNVLKKEGVYAYIENQTKTLISEIENLARINNIALSTNRVGSMFGLFFTENKNISSFDDVKKCDVKRFKKFFILMLKEGIYFPPSHYETSFFSLAHTDNEIEKTLHAVNKVFKLI
ncbi:glutamate-1-semialdehyde 2,1-aminomutase (plasmid) [Candidatus Photodesmus blepharus]|uniref:Glutamate-1-semialdehyde 2,1-aminomutase n=1 Tax=Candidatus Photodesmus blepharonis TaxID=1179155 RepID=A0A084CNW1_9GAMM|nr:glutamate-1-semialdehyde 2,1-aminomutase [Candidatus Photodesmus blepharus]KEY91490.1 glutamate-1-semialdehyde 2,1-aminomutase [Candidatus Photodesmus blepharus]